MAIKDLSGKTFGRLTAISYSHKVKQGAVWNCICTCGTTKLIIGKILSAGMVKSCGCLKRETGKLVNRKHGLSHRSMAYSSWASARLRCRCKTHLSYPRYGGRGIKVCERWINSFENFLADMGEPPSREYSLDRIDNDGNYEPGNCRWATRKTQHANTCRNRKIKYGGSTYNLKEFADIVGRNTTSVAYWLDKKGATAEQIVARFKEKNEQP